MFHLDGKTFRSISNSGSGEVGSDTLFRYQQKGNLVTAHYAGGHIRAGHLIALMAADGSLDMRYHHVNNDGALMLGKCQSRPEVLPDGRLKYCESWQWLSGDGSSGYSEIEEVPEGSALEKTPF